MSNIITCVAQAENVQTVRVSWQRNGDGFTNTIIARDSLLVNAVWKSLVGFESLNGTKFSLFSIWLCLEKKHLFPHQIQRKGYKKKTNIKHAVDICWTAEETITVKSE